MASPNLKFKVPVIDYTSRDFEGIRDSLISAIPFFTPEWTDHNVSDFGIVLLELFAYVADGLHFYVDRLANECYLPTAVTRRSVVNLLKLIDYTMSGPVPASANVEIVNSGLTPVTLPAGTVLSTTGETIYYFETQSEVTIAPGTYETVSVLEGRTYNDTFDVLVARTFLSVTLTRNNVYLESIKVYVDEGAGEVLWTKVDSFLNSGPFSLVYQVEENSDGFYVIRFGDGVQGKIPAATSTIRVEYRQGVGAAGNVGANTITTFVSPPVSGLSVNNPLPASGGNDAESIEKAKILGPKSLKALYRAVTPDDYATLVLAEFEEIKKAKAVVQDSHNVLNGCCTMTLYLFPSGGGEPSNLLKQRIYDFLQKRKMACTVIDLQGPCFEKVKIEGIVQVKEGYDIDKVQQDVTNAITAMFEEDSAYIDFGAILHQSDLYSVVLGVDGVEVFDLKVFTLLPVPVLNPWRGDAVFSDIKIAPTTEPDSWDVVFIDSTHFSVRGANAGFVGTGEIGIEFSGPIIFTINNSGTPMEAGDRAIFRTTEKVGAITPLEGCLLELGSLAITYTQDSIEEARRSGRCV